MAHYERAAGTGKMLDPYRRRLKREASLLVKRLFGRPRA
jgi:hypothetical protein